MDLSMPGLSGIETTRQLKALLPEVRVLILTVHEDKELLQEAIRVGASGYISKRAAEADLINAIFAVWRGIIYVQPQLMRSLVSLDQPKPCDEYPEAETLTPREIEVLRLIVQGHTNRQIAEVLNLSSRTVESHRANLMGKLNLHSRVEVVRYAAEHGLLELNDRANRD
jgi:DNA-binding NarL/FixJ family response regulator